MGQGASSRSAGQTTSDPQREAARPLPILRPVLELSGTLDVLSRRTQDVEKVAQPPQAGHPHVMGDLQQTSGPLSLAEAADYPFLGQLVESSMRGCTPASELCGTGIAEETSALIGHGGGA